MVDILTTDEVKRSHPRAACESPLETHMYQPDLPLRVAIQILLDIVVTIGDFALLTYNRRQIARLQR